MKILSSLVNRFESRVHKIQDGLADTNIAALEAKETLTEGEAQMLSNMRSYRANRRW